MKSTIYSAILSTALSTTVLVGSSLPLFADEQPTGATTVPSAESGYLGVVVTSAHPALAANLNGLLKPDQGLTVEDVAKDSAAMKAGIKIHDVLTIYDDQKLFSPEQFAKLVHSDRPGRKVTLGVLREGKITSATITLGKLDQSDYRNWSPSPHAQPYRFGHPDRIPRRFPVHPVPALEWENFDSLTLKNLGSNKFRAEMQYRDKNGTSQKFVFEGDRDQIHKALDEAKDMLPAQRAHLLRSLNMYDPGNPMPYPHVWFEPGLGWFFEQPGGPFH